MDTTILETPSSTASTTIVQPSQQPSSINIWPPLCQICGTLLKIDTSIEQMSDAQYKQLTCSYMTARGGDGDMETVTTISDADMDLSMAANIQSVQQQLPPNISSSSSTSNLGAIVRDRSGTLGGGATGTTVESLAVTTTDADTTTYFEPVYSKSVPPRNFCSLNTSISIADSSEQNQNTNECSGWSQRINTISSLFDIMSANTQIDQPLCEDCADQLINQLDVQCKIIQKEQCEYSNLLHKLQQENVNPEELEILSDELKTLELEEKDLLKQLDQFENEEQQLEKQIEEKLAEEEKLIEQEEKHLIDYCNYKRTLMSLEEKQASLDNQLRQTKIHYNRLRTTNVLNAAFHIWHSGPFGTINYFRLGRLPDTPVEWDEINAALGQVALLLHSLARKVRLDFKRYRLVPFGNYSYIEVIDNVPALSLKKGDQLHMYGAGGFKYYFEWDKKFDVGMVAFLDCLLQFEDKIKSIDPSFSMPYPINGYKLEDKKTSSSYSIKCHLNSHEEWTKALKYMLTNLKWSLAWVASQYD